MRSRFLRLSYSNRAARLGTNFLFLCVVYFFISLRHPEYLLVLGPLLLGFPHLVASAILIPKTVRARLKTPVQRQVFVSFALLTAFSVALQIARFRFHLIPELPNGSWEIYLSMVASLFFATQIPDKNWSHIVAALLSFLVFALVLNFAWQQPLIFVGLALFLHNWIAFFYWVKVAKERATQLTAVLATLIFGLIHYLVLSGRLDAWIAVGAPHGIFQLAREASGSTLAPWTMDSQVWARALVLYTFGLSLHYFIWLRAIPECLGTRQTPHSWRESYRQLTLSCGAKTAGVLVVFFLLLPAAWLLSYSPGRLMYFRIASLHGWLEFVFLVNAILLYLLDRAFNIAGLRHRSCPKLNTPPDPQVSQCMTTANAASTMSG